MTDESAVEVLLGSIGMTACLDNSSMSMQCGLLCVEDQSSHAPASAECIDKVTWYGFYSHQHLLYHLFNTIVSFKFKRTDRSGHETMEHVKNPYLGCRSLEEAMIRKDLIANGN